MDLYERIAELGSMGYHCSQMMMIMTLETIGGERRCSDETGCAGTVSVVL